MNRAVLVIEDDRQSARWIKVYLERAGFSAELAFTAEQGRERFRQGKADLILLDLMLPDGDGRELCREFRRESDVPVIMLTARSAREDGLRASPAELMITLQNPLIRMK